MEDIVERLRFAADDTDAVENASVASLLEDAAAEIHRLRITDEEMMSIEAAVRIIEAREAEIDRLQKREALWQWCAERTTETYGGCYRPEYAEKVRAAAKELAGDCTIERRE